MEVARFFWKDYIFVEMLSPSIDELADIIARMRGWEAIRSVCLVSRKAEDLVITEFIAEITGITDE